MKRPRNFNISSRTRLLIREALREDIGSGDVTTSVLVPSTLKGEAYIEAKVSGIVCGGAVVREVFRLIDSRLKVVQKVSDGSRVSEGKEVFRLRGRIASILKGERTALNFLGRLSGIATLTHQYVQKVKGTSAQIFDTRKTTPLWRELEKYAVRSGGGKNHRFGLWDEILVKDNHWLAMRPLLEKTRCRYFEDRLVQAGLALPAARQVLAPKGLGCPHSEAVPLRRQGVPLRKKRKIPIETEVRSFRELSHLLKGTVIPDRILLDHFRVAQLRRAVSFVHNRYRRSRGGVTPPLLEASGGIHIGNVRAIAQTGVDRISVGALTHSAPALDVSLTVGRVGRVEKD